MIDDEEIVKALSLEEKALDEFKRRKNSVPQTKSASMRNSEDYRKRSQPARPTSVATTQEEKDLINWQEVPHTSSKKLMEENPYNKFKESILKLSTSASNQTQQNLQMMPYNKQPQPSLSPESLNSLYNMNSNINHYYSQNMYYAQPPPVASPYPAIGFSHFMQQQPTFSPYGSSTYYQTQQYNWTQSSSSIVAKHNTTPTQSAELKVAASAAASVTVLSVKSSASSTSSERAPQPQSYKPSTSASDNLIDFDVDDSKYVANILHTFDPLSSNRNSSEDAENTYYSDQDPFDYIYSGGTHYSDPLYEAVVRSDPSMASPKSQTPQDISEYYAAPISTDDPRKPPPLPPRNLNKTESYEEATQQNGSVAGFSRKLYENVTHLKKFDRDLIAFYTMVKELRSKYIYSNESSNIGHIVAAELDNKYMNVSSIKLLVYPSLECFQGRFTDPHGDRNQENYQRLDGYTNPIVFTCEINANVSHVILHVLTELEDVVSGKAEDFALKTIGSQEWLSEGSSLSHLEYIQSNIKLEKDIQLGLFPKQNKYMKILARTQQDDLRDADIKLENILPKDAVSAISYDSLMILLETLEMEIDKLESAAGDNLTLHPSGVVQGVKAICALLGCIDTLELFNAINNLKEACQVHSSFAIRQSTSSIYSKSSTINIVSEQGNYARVTLRPRKPHEDIRYHCGEVRDAVQHLLEMYSLAFQVNFSVNGPQWNSAQISITDVFQNVMINIVALHRPPQNWKHDEYMLGVQIYHGTKFLGEPMITHCSNSTNGFYPRLTFDAWMHFDEVSVCTLPRESRLVFVLYGCTKEPVDGQAAENTSQNNSISQESRMTKVELGWSSIQFFDFERKMIQGTYFLSLWPPSSDKYYCPSPPRGTHPLGDFCPVLSIEVPTYGGKLTFPESIKNVPIPEAMDFESLDRNLQEELIDTIFQGFAPKIEKREVLWEKRYYLHSFPRALPKILNAAHSWDFACLADLHALMKSWSPLKPLEAIELLLPRFPDLEVRSQAVKWISMFSNDDLIDYLPQLLQAMKHDIYEASPLSCFLLGRSLDSPRVAHYLYWLLIQNLPGDAPQNSMEQNQIYEDDYVLLQARFHRRNQLMLRALLAICGEKLSSRFLSQNLMCKALDDVAKSVKVAKESLKLSILRQNIENVHQILCENPTSLPLSPGIEVRGIQARTCTYFNSNTLPLKINFLGPDKLIIPAIFKCGDDLQQDMLTLQIVRIIDKMWMKEGLNLKIVHFACVPTGHKKGMIEMITNAETLRKIQVEWGLTGSFKDKPIAEWLAKQNPNQLEYQRAVENFTASCAGYSIITYILGICDRHNDNIMLKTSGHLFHIDFGKFLGDAQMFGNFKRDRVPFVLTSDMAYVINGGDRPSSKFHNFVDLCCQAFNIVRKHGDLLLHMFALMASSGIPGVTSDAVSYVRNALMPGASNPEASANFAKMIHISLKSWFTQFNFFLHNIAQMRFGNETQGGELLSFIPKTYTVEQDGCIENVSVHSYQKRYDLEKYYTYILKVYRQNQPDPAYLFRAYKEFCELHQKLCLLFPLARLHSLQTGISVGRSNIKTVAEKRLPEVKKFLQSLLRSAPEILNSDLVITFFHPLLRDQQEADIEATKLRESRPVSEANICGEIKFSIHYHRDTFIVMIHHARSLPTATGGQEPNTYVKTYLIPDRSKITKRKTKVIKKSCFPSFMETLEYRMPIQAIKLKNLQITVWEHDTLQENEFLGGVQLPLVDLNLKEEIVGWYRLGYLPRT